MYIAQVSFPRDTVGKDSKFKWKRIGALWMTDEGEAELHLRAWRQGDWVAVLLKNISYPPFFEGSLTGAYTGGDGKRKTVFCGRIYSHQEADAKTAYTGSLEAMPLPEDGMFKMTVKRDDKE